MKIRLLGLLALTLASGWTCGAAGATEPATPRARYSLSAGFDYSTGDYGLDSNTDMVAIPVIARCDVDRWIIKLTVPYLYVSGPGNVISGVGAVAPPGQAADRTRSGLGDLVTAVTYNTYDNPASGLLVDVTAKVKFGTASRRQGLGTGETDLSGEVDVYQKIGDLTPFGSLGYKILGSPPEYNLNNVYFITVGLDYRIVEGASVGASFFFQQRLSDTLDPARELSAYVSHRLPGAWRIQGYVLTGFTDASPKFEIGGQLGHAF